MSSSVRLSTMPYWNQPGVVGSLSFRSSISVVASCRVYGVLQDW